MGKEGGTEGVEEEEGGVKGYWDFNLQDRKNFNLLEPVFQNPHRAQQCAQQHTAAHSSGCAQ